MEIKQRHHHRGEEKTGWTGSRIKALQPSAPQPGRYKRGGSRRTKLPTEILTLERVLVKVFDNWKHFCTFLVVFTQLTYKSQSTLLFTSRIPNNTRPIFVELENG